MSLCSPAAPLGPLPLVSLVTKCVHGQGCRRRLPGMRSGSWGWPISPFSHPPSGLGWAAPASRRVLGPQTAGPVHPSPSPSQAPGACQVVRLPVTLSGSSSLPGKAAEWLGGRGRRPPSSGSAAPRLSTLGPAVPEGVSGPGPASEAIWGPPGVRVGSRSRSGPWAETRRLLSQGGLVQVPQMSVTLLTTCGCYLQINKTWVEERTRQAWCASGRGNPSDWLTAGGAAESVLSSCVFAAVW